MHHNIIPSGENQSTGSNIDWQILSEEDSDIEEENQVALSAHALRKAKARERIEQNQKYSKPELPYIKQRKKIERNLGYIGTSILDIRDKTTDRQAIRQELRDYGVDSIDQLGNINYSYEQILLPEQVFKKFNKLFVFLGEDTKGSPNLIEEYQQITDKKEQLSFILSSSLSDKVRLFCSESFNYPNYDNFMHSLQFQQDFINGTAKVSKKEWDSSKDTYVDTQIPLDPALANKGDILLGLNRASLKSAMIGTPEYGAYKISTDIIKDRDWYTPADYPKISGYQSGITNKYIGSWEKIIDEYRILADKIARRNPDINKENLEYITVRKVAKIFADSADYNDNTRGPDSPYVSSFHESVVWAQLGYGVQRQLRGIRQKLIGYDLSGIERFIGKSGDSHKRGYFESEKYRLAKSKKYIKSLPSANKQEFLAKENAFEINKQEEWREKEVGRIKHKYEKLISKTRNEERRATYASRQDEEIQRVLNDTSGKIKYFENRTLDGLLSDINKRQQLLSHRIEKRKSLAEKAIDLSFRLGNKHEEWDNELEEYVSVGGSLYKGHIDWINSMPFGVIKRSHKRMIDGIPDNEIYRLAIIETIQKAVNDPEKVEAAIVDRFQSIEDGSTDVNRISKVVNLTNKLYLVPKLSRITKEFGYDLDINQLIELSDKEIINLYDSSEVNEIFTSALRNFSLDEVMIAMDADIDLIDLNLAKKMDPDADFEKTISFSKKIEKTYRLMSNLNLDDVRKLIEENKLDPDTISEYPWLKYQYHLSGDHELLFEGAGNFPAKESDSSKYKWCARSSFIHLDGDWPRQRIGKIIFTRLQSGIDYSIHDATHWLSVFQMPESAYNISEIKKHTEQGESIITRIEDYSMRLYDKDEERKYLARILSAPYSIRNRLNLSAKEQNIHNFFSAPENIFLYKELRKIFKDPEISFAEYRNIIQDESKLRNFYNEEIVESSGKNSCWRMSFADFEERVNEATNGVFGFIELNDQHNERIGEIAQRLIQYGINRKAYIDDATSWLTKHSVSSQNILTVSWGNRAFAIADGVKDNLSEINAWSKMNAITENSKDLLMKNGISIEDLKTSYAPLLKELSRCYSSDIIAETIVTYKNIHNPEKIMPAESITVEVEGRKFTGEVLAHDDPRGMTIGYDTGCCMTVIGPSHSCIESGYRDPGAGFFAYYDEDNKINAQSYFFTDPTHPEIVVMDNIEANAGRDSSRIIKIYQNFFRQYLKNRFTSDSNWKIRQVNVGTGYGELAKAQVLKLQSTEIVPNNLSEYSDARKDQRILIRLSDEEIAEARAKSKDTLKLEKSVEPDHSPSFSVSPLGINQISILQSIEEQLYPKSMRQYGDEEFAQRELMMPDANKYSFLIKTKIDATSEADGYCLAYKAESESDPNYPEKVVYIADFGILPGSRGGMTALKGFDELLKRLDENDIKKVEMDARESTSFKLLTSNWGKRYLKRKGYNLVVHDSIESFDGGETTILISLEKIT